MFAELALDLPHLHKMNHGFTSHGVIRLHYQLLFIWHNMDVAALIYPWFKCFVRENAQLFSNVDGYLHSTLITERPLTMIK